MEIKVRSKLYEANKVKRRPLVAQSLTVVENAAKEAAEINPKQKGKNKQPENELYSGAFALPAPPEKRVTRSKAADVAPVAKRLRKSRK
jgi:hypothetical protein